MPLQCLVQGTTYWKEPPLIVKHTRIAFSHSTTCLKTISTLMVLGLAACPFGHYWYGVLSPFPPPCLICEKDLKSVLLDRCTLQALLLQALLDGEWWLSPRKVTRTLHPPNCQTPWSSSWRPCATTGVWHRQWKKMLVALLSSKQSF